MLKVVSASAGAAVSGLLSLPLHQQAMICALVRIPADQVAVSLVRKKIHIKTATCSMLANTL
jgi:hypothetical protein